MPENIRNYKPWLRAESGRRVSGSGRAAFDPPAEARSCEKETDEQSKLGGRHPCGRRSSEFAAQFTDWAVCVSRGAGRIFQLERRAARMARNLRLVRPVAPHD